MNEIEIRPSTTAFRTKNWIVAALCLTKGLRLSGVERNGVCYFVFEEADKARSIEESFYHGKININAREFTDAQRRIKDLIHAHN